MKDGAGEGLGLGLVALVGIGCCVGLPLLAAASISVTALAWGGAVLGGLVTVAVFSAVLLRRRARAGASHTPGERSKPSATRLSKEVKR